MWRLDGPLELLDCDERLTVVRQGRTVDTDLTYEDGVPVALRPPDQFEIICTIQPMNGRDLLLVPESFRDKETYWLWVRHQAGETSGPAIDVADIVLRNNTAFQVQAAEDWGSYSRCMLVAVDVGLTPGTDGPIFGQSIYPGPAN